MTLLVGFKSAALANLPCRYSLQKLLHIPTSQYSSSSSVVLIAAQSTGTAKWVTMPLHCVEYNRASELCDCRAYSVFPQYDNSSACMGLACCRRSYTLPVVDHAGRLWEFVVKSWANGSEHRRVFVLEQAGPFIRMYGLREGDCLGICTDAAGALVIEVRLHKPQV